MIKLIVGLGNPGRLYANNRHNIGFRCINRLTKIFGIELDKKKFRAEIGRGTFEGKDIILAKPRTYMNLSGESVAPLLGHFRLDVSGLLVIYDDLDLPLGKMRIRTSGSSGGHRGMASIINAVGSREIARIRIGVGRPQEANHPEAEADFLLANFSPSERKIIEEVIETGAQAVKVILGEGIQAAMNKFN